MSKFRPNCHRSCHRRTWLESHGIIVVCTSFRPSYFVILFMINLLITLFGRKQMDLRSMFIFQIAQLRSEVERIWRSWHFLIRSMRRAFHISKLGNTSSMRSSPQRLFLRTTQSWGATSNQLYLLHWKRCARFPCSFVSSSWTAFPRVSSALINNDLSALVWIKRGWQL